ncbi:MAG: hypothetical protein GSR80_001682 [Desulfurococcales archaeon]|nr:hypothetical protein [Desulfurococcales archaeon]
MAKSGPPPPYKDVFDMYREALHNLRRLVALLRTRSAVDLGLLASRIDRGTSFNPVWANIVAVLSELADIGEGDTATRASKLYAYLARLLDYSLNYIVDACSSRLRSRRRAHVAVMGYSEAIARCIASAKRGIARVNVLEARPDGDGMVLFRELGSRGIGSVLVPDYAVQQVVEESDAVIVTLDAVTYDGASIVRMGVKPLLLAAAERSVDVIALTHSAAFSAALSSEDYIPGASVKVYMNDIKDYVSRALYDKVPLDLASIVIYEKGVKDPSTLDVEEESLEFMQAAIQNVVGEEL